MDKEMNILFVHPLEGNAYELYKAFERKKNINIIPLLKEKLKLENNLITKIRHKIRLHKDSFDINNKLLSYNLDNIDIVFIVKGNEVYPDTLKKISKKFPSIKLINWSLDDMSGWHTKSLFFHYGLKYYDLVYTTKTYNISRLKKIGAKKIKYITQAYSNDIHKKPQKTSKLFEYDVLFIGRAEKERFETKKFLANNGINVNIYGTGWEKKPYKHQINNLFIHKHPLFNENYALAIASSKITLTFLSKINEDLHTSRSFEIPACGGFMIAERTSEHTTLFEENKEAVYFSSNNELLEKINYYLNNEIVRKEIINNALKRSKSSGYSYDDMADKLVIDFQELYV